MMMHSMMSGAGSIPLFWVALAGLLLLGAFLWLAVRWLKGRKAALRQSTQQPHESVVSWPSYEQGYQAQQSAQEMYQEGGHTFPSVPSQGKQPRAQQDEIMSSQHS
jgi:hypothetical protein